LSTVLYSTLQDYEAVTLTDAAGQSEDALKLYHLQHEVMQSAGGLLKRWQSHSAGFSLRHPEASGVNMKILEKLGWLPDLA
jgi:hypothetical protein